MPKEPVDVAELERETKALIEITNALASSLDFREILLTVVKRIAEVVQVDRVSIVITPTPSQAKVGFVVVTSDDENLHNLPIDLGNYPEIQKAIQSRKPVVIEDAANHPLLDMVEKDLRPARLSILTLVPIIWEDQATGVLFLRSAEGRGALSPRELGFCTIIANTAAVALRNARVMQNLRDHTQQETFARFEAERRIQSLKRYADLFASSAEGIAVIDQRGTILFANPRSYEVLGFTEGAFSGTLLFDMVHPGDLARTKSIVRGFADGEFPKEIDLRVVRGDGKVLICNVSFSSLLDGEGTVLLSFRDVTAHRHTAEELERTKNFLEQLVAASPDGIIASDISGEIIVYNQSAERIHERKAEEVIGKISVEDLYPPGLAREIMAMIRSPLHGGVGRLESLRFEAQNVRGELVPIMLSAAMIYDDEGHEKATFGIFTDLRERLSVEDRLAQAQERLRMSERQAVVAELAGTAAHELNQPLTSVMAYAELLKKRLAADTLENRAASTIMREAERMADIVRKIGKITKYETKSYVGEQKIIDLDKSAEGDK
ncbi:MAG: PAS domain S-box protein [Myxococcales bacterium]|nr:PAS domain S-box protein [Myxococcales bacterium]